MSTILKKVIELASNRPCSSHHGSVRNRSSSNSIQSYSSLGAFEIFPEDILIHIMKLLGPKDAAKMSLLCRSWKSIVFDNDRLWIYFLQNQQEPWEEIFFAETNLRLGYTIQGFSSEMQQLSFMRIYSQREQVPGSLVIDGGSGYCKFGWSKYDCPSGRSATFLEFGNIESPMHSRLWHFFDTIYSRMQVKPSTHPIVLSIPLCHYDDNESAKAARRQLKEAIYATLFEMNVPAVCAINQNSCFVYLNRVAKKLQDLVLDAEYLDDSSLKRYMDFFHAKCTQGGFSNIKKLDSLILIIGPVTSVHILQEACPGIVQTALRCVLSEICTIGHELTPVLIVFDLQKATLALFAARRTSGIAVNIGFQVTSVVPILNGKVMRKVGVEVNGVGALKLTGFLRELMQQNNISFKSLYTVRALKEKLCYVAADYEAELCKNTRASYEVPGEGLFTLTKERFQTGEILFQPHIAGVRTMGLHQAIALCMEHCHASGLNPDDSWFKTVVLCGGTACLPGLAERLEKELQDQLPPYISSGIKVVPPPYGADTAWFGAKLIGNLSTFPGSWCVTKKRFKPKSRFNLIW